MKALCLLVLAVSSLAWSKDKTSIEVVTTHVATRTDRGNRAVFERSMLGPIATGKTVEVYNLDAVINGEHVILACDDDKGCEAPKPGTYEGEVLSRGHVRMKFSLPLSEKSVNRWYKVAGTW